MRASLCRDQNSFQTLLIHTLLCRLELLHSRWELGFEGAEDVWSRVTDGEEFRTGRFERYVLGVSGALSRLAPQCTDHKRIYQSPMGGDRI